MKFMEAFQEMLKGNCCIRRGNLEWYIVIMPNQDYIWKVLTGTKNPVVPAMIYSPSIDEIEATDWLIQ